MLISLIFSLLLSLRGPGSQLDGTATPHNAAGKHEDCIGACVVALELVHPPEACCGLSARLLLWKASALFACRKLPEALEDLERACDLNPLNVDCLLLKAEVGCLSLCLDLSRRELRS